MTSDLLTLAHALLGASVSVTFTWIDDRTAEVRGVRPHEFPVSIFSLDRCAIVEAGGVLLDTQHLRRLVSSAILSELSSAPTAALVVAAEAPEDGGPPLGGLLAIWEAPHQPFAGVERQVLGWRSTLARALRPARDAVERDRLEARFEAVMGTTAQGLVFVDDTTGEGTLNNAAARLLDMPAGAVDPARLAAAMHALRTSASNAESLEREARRMFVNPLFRIDNWVWSYASDDGDGARALRVASAPVRGAHVSGRVWMFDDVSAEYSAEAALVTHNEELERANVSLADARAIADEANAAKSAFLATMSHELRTPLNSIIGFTNVLRRNTRGHLDVNDLLYLDRVAQNGTHLLSLINSILDLAKIESGKMSTEVASVDLASLVREVAAQFEPQLSGRTIDLRIEMPAAAIVTSTDATKLSQILLNLLSNAVKFTSAGAITVSLQADSAGLPLAISVRDTGSGIPADRLDAVFQPFEQATAGTSRTHGGTGLGLTIARAMCELLGLTLTADSVEGAGSTFTIGWPSYTGRVLVSA